MARTHKTQPAADQRVTKIGMIRDLFDSATGPITSKHLPLLAEMTGFELGTIKIQFYKWRAERRATR